MKYLFFAAIVLAVLAYLGVININSGRAKEVARSGANKGIELAKQGVAAAEAEAAKVPVETPAQ